MPVSGRQSLRTGALANCRQGQQQQQQRTTPQGNSRPAFNSLYLHSKHSQITPVAAAAKSAAVRVNAGKEAEEDWVVVARAEEGEFNCKTHIQTSVDETRRAPSSSSWWFGALF